MAPRHGGRRGGEEPNITKNSHFLNTHKVGTCMIWFIFHYFSRITLDITSVYRRKLWGAHVIRALRHRTKWHGYACRKRKRSEVQEQTDVVGKNVLPMVSNGNEKTLLISDNDFKGQWVSLWRKKKSPSCHTKNSLISSRFQIKT